MKRDYLGVVTSPVVDFTYYRRDRTFAIKGTGSAAQRRTLVTPSNLFVGILGSVPRIYCLESALDLYLDSASSWDTQTPTDYTVAANRIGKDFYVYACVPVSGSAPKIVLSANTTYPDGYNALNSRKIGGFHCLPGDCVNLPSGHPYKDFLLGDILFNSIWDLHDRPRSSPEGMAKISLTPSDGLPALWCDIYLASGDGTICTSVFGATIQGTKTWYQFNEYAALQKKRLMSFDEFTVIAEGSNQQTSIYGSSDPVTVTFPVDTAGRSMISNYGIIGCCGVVWQWTRDHNYRLPDSGDLASCQAFAWINQGNNKGSANLQNSGYAESVLFAGGAWYDGSNCGSRCRRADYLRTAAASSIGCRFVSDHA